MRRICVGCLPPPTALHVQWLAEVVGLPGSLFFRKQSEWLLPDVSCSARFVFAEFVANDSTLAPPVGLLDPNGSSPKINCAGKPLPDKKFMWQSIVQSTFARVKSGPRGVYLWGPISSSALAARGRCVDPWGWQYLVLAWRTCREQETAWHSCREQETAWHSCREQETAWQTCREQETVTLCNLLVLRNALGNCVSPAMISRNAEKRLHKFKVRFQETGSDPAKCERMAILQWHSKYRRNVEQFSTRRAQAFS